MAGALAAEDAEAAKRQAIAIYQRGAAATGVETGLMESPLMGDVRRGS